MHNATIRSAVVPTAGRGRLSPVDAAGLRVTGGLWAERLTTNRERTIPHGLEHLEASGALGNFRNAARGTGLYVGGNDDSGATFPFLDSDVYKWLEAVGWELGRQGDAGLAGSADRVIELVAAAQRPSGYLGTFVQLSGRQEFSDLQWGHELYCIGHLIQAAVAWQRALGDDRLLGISTRAVERIERELGPGGRDGIDGHPEIEMALVELYRVTRSERYLALASHLIEGRGRGLLGQGRFGAGYWQDVAPVRSAPAVTGHAVRQLYLDCGAVDVAVEKGDDVLLEAVIRRWDDMLATRMYLTGGVESHHRDEAFGAPYELPSDRAYTETCAAIASVMLAWRLLLATGESRYADLIERTLFNAVLPGISLDGTHFFYVNPLLQRGSGAGEPEAAYIKAGARRPWYPCACCPPNVMRTLSSFEQLLATVDDAGLQVHQYATGSIEVQRPGGPLSLRVVTDYPWQGRVELAVERSPAEPWALSLRVPAWCGSATLTTAAGGPVAAAGGDRTTIERSWRPGDRVVLDLELQPRMTAPDHRIDAVRGCVAIERGPLVYCVEDEDLPSGAQLTEHALSPERPLRDVPAPEGLPGRGVEVSLVVRDTSTRPDWPYAEAAAAGSEDRGSLRVTDVRAIPYFAWANRGVGAMRVWLPVLPGVVPGPALDAR